MGPKTRQLLNIIDEIILLLKTYQVSDWQHFLLKVKNRLTCLDYSGVALFQSAYGGMGSINDLVFGYDILSDTGEIIWDEVSKASNERFQVLLIQASQLMVDIDQNVLVSTS